MSALPMNHEFPVRVKNGIALVLSEKTASGSRSRRGAHEIARKPAQPVSTHNRLLGIRWASQECLLRHAVSRQSFCGEQRPLPHGYKTRNKELASLTSSRGSAERSFAPKSSAR